MDKVPIGRLRSRELWKQRLVDALRRADPGARVEDRATGETVIDGEFDLYKVADYMVEIARTQDYRRGARGRDGRFVPRSQNDG